MDLTPLHPRTPRGAGTRPTNTGGGGGSSSMGRRPGSSALGGDRAVGEGGGAPSTGRSTTFNPVSSAEPYFRPFNVTPSSVSQFVMSEASRGSPSPLLTHQSPVLNTEELYRAAGWMTPLPKDAANRDGVGGGGGIGGGDSDGDEGMADAAAPAARLAVLSAKNDQHDTSQRMAHSLSLGSSGGAGGAGTGAAAAATAAGEAADRIREEIAREPVLSLANLSGFGGEPGGPADGDGGSGSEGSDSGSGEGAGADPGEEYSSEEPGIPKSIAEIYEVRVFA